MENDCKVKWSETSTSCSDDATTRVVRLSIHSSNELLKGCNETSEIRHIPEQKHAYRRLLGILQAELIEALLRFLSLVQQHCALHSELVQLLPRRVDILCQAFGYQHK